MKKKNVIKKTSKYIKYIIGVKKNKYTTKVYYSIKVVYVTKRQLNIFFHQY